ncbi:hypothetical protein ANRL3_00159 [Anaerolineae bacterium]|nr:hypothetical protein ANRL3_00159 [Anaerolineae bacterium]
MNQTDLDRLVCAGVVDEQFRALLVRDPLSAVEEGFYGEVFHLTEAERVLIANIHASDFDAFVREIARWVLHQRGQELE